jgi:hypothetical protein
MSWPHVSTEATSKYDKHSNLFLKAFPWLFPGGVGDYNQYREEKLSVIEWAKRLVLYQEVDFQKTKCGDVLLSIFRKDARISRPVVFC